MALIKCEECGREVSDKAPSCPGCGVPVATPRSFQGMASSSDKTVPPIAPTRTTVNEPAKKKTSLLTWIVLIILGLWFINNNSISSFINDIIKGYKPAELAHAKKPAESEYDSTPNIDYRKALLEEIQKGSLLSFSGQIVQVIGQSQAMINTKKNLFGYDDERTLLVFGEKPQIIEGDVVNIHGRYNGTETYRTVLGAENTVPSIIVDYYSVAHPKN